MFSPSPANAIPTLSQVTTPLIEIATHIQIEANFQIRHSHYPPLDLPEAVINRYCQLPSQFQQRFLVQKLRDYLYDIYFSHEPDLGTDATGATHANQEAALKNELVRGLNRDFYAQLHNANPGQGYFDESWKVLRQETDGSLAVQKEELTIHIERDRHLKSSQQFAQPGDEVAVRLPKNCLENGFYIAVGNAGLVPETADRIEICFNISSVGAIALMANIPAVLNAAKLPFSLKALYDPTEYGRYDAVTLQVESDHYKAIQVPLRTFYQQARSHFSLAIPIFMKPLAPGIGLAEDPDDEALDFGLQRCQLVAQGLLAAREMGNETPEHRLHCIIQQFNQHQVDLQQPYLNPGSGDRYPALTGSQ